MPSPPCRSALLFSHLDPTERQAVVRNRYRVTIECEVETFDMTPERMLELQEEREAHLRECESCRLQGLEDPPTEESLAGQRLLREVLLRNPDLLDQWMQREIMLHLAESGVEEARPSASETEILKPVVETLP